MLDAIVGVVLWIWFIIIGLTIFGPLLWKAVDAYKGR